MSKKDIQKLSDAMLENVEVSDGVLDMAREQMRATSKEPVSSPAGKEKRARFSGAKGGAIAVNRKAIAVVCACAVVAVIAVAVFVWSLNRGSFNSSNDGGSYYELSRLTESEITSISDYNEENGTSYICPENIDASTILYSDGDTPVLFEESFTYSGTNCIWYVVVNENDYVDILDIYSDLYNSSAISDYDVYYSLDGGGQYARFICGDSKYCVYAEADGENILDILINILT